MLFWRCLLRTSSCLNIEGQARASKEDGDGQEERQRIKETEVER
jgi:hypothetical protein